MKTIYRFAENIKSPALKELKSFNINIDKGEIIAAFVIDSCHEQIDDILRVSRELEMFICSWVEFDSNELENAQYLELYPVWVQGYPQPENNFTYKKRLYDMKCFCNKCNTGRVQIAPFKMKKEPYWRGRKVMGLRWVKSEVFVTPDLYESVFAPLGVDYWPVVRGRDVELETVVQLRVDTIAPGAAKPMDGFKKIICEACGSLRYGGNLLDFAPRPTAFPDAEVFRVQEQFGSGGETSQPIIVSQAVYQKITEAKVKGVGFHPLLATGEDRPLRVE